MPHRYLALWTPMSLTSLLATFLGLGGVVVGQADLHQYSVEIMGALSVVVGGVLLAVDQVRKQRLRSWIEQQQAERKEWVEWAKVKGPGLEQQIADLNATLKESTEERRKLREEASRREAMVLELTERIEQLVVAASKASCKYAVDGERHCRIDGGH